MCPKHSTQIDELQLNEIPKKQLLQPNTQHYDAP